MTKRKGCTFCDQPAAGSYARVRFCRSHLILFYLSLNTEWHD